MSRQIDLTKPLSEDDRLYLESRGLQAQLDTNALHLMGGGADEEAPNEAPAVIEPVTPAPIAPEPVPAPTPVAPTAPVEPVVAPVAPVEPVPAVVEDEPYKGVTVPDLKAEIDTRNEGREDTAKIAVAEPGNRPEIVAALVADDEASKTAE